MFISKNLLNHPLQRPASMDERLYNKAKTYHQYFSDNDLWYVDEARTKSHIFFDGEYCVEVAPTYVHFLSGGSANDFQLVDANGTIMMRHKRTLKPLIYYPMYESSGISLSVNKMAATEEILFDLHPDLKNYCLYNRHIGWTIDMCNNTYPINVGVSKSMHTHKFINWFKDTHAIIATGTKMHLRRVSAIRFSTID